MVAANSFGARGTLDVAGQRFEVHRLSALDGVGEVARLPYSLKVLLENHVRREGDVVTADDVEALARCDPRGTSDRELSFAPARILMQDFTGVPAVVDLAAMRDAMADLGADPAQVNPLVPA